MTAQEKLHRQIEKNHHISVGLDTDLDKIPLFMRDEKYPLFEFNKKIIDSTQDSAAAYKINFAFYEKYGSEGIKQLEKTLEYVPEENLIIADSKRGDIGNTSRMYADSVFHHFKADAVTLHPYMGIDTVQPFIDHKDKFSFILALTSNPSSADFEKQLLNSGKPLYSEVINKVNDWNINRNCGVVFGATNPAELSENIGLLKDLVVLIPGIGAQGGDLNEIVKILKISNIDKFIVNISRALIYADSSAVFAEVCRNKLVELNDKILEGLN